ncbi:MAG: hypothetical protein H0W63_07455 [Gemmatimonadaceae bacterium]|nr:hypothetical protein [Gemmatimonadaceae bacterium]
MTNRAGVEAKAVARLTGGVEPPESRAILVQCLNGELSPAVAIVRMLSVSHDVASVRAAIDHITLHAAERSRAGDTLVRDRADSLTQLFVDNVRECEEIVAMAENDGHSMSESAADRGACWDAYSRLLRVHPPG